MTAHRVGAGHMYTSVAKASGSTGRTALGGVDRSNNDMYWPTLQEGGNGNDKEPSCEVGVIVEVVASDA